MSTIVESLESILDSVVRELVFAGVEPRQMVNRVLRNAQWLCESELLGLAQQRISNMDATTAASNNRTKEEGLWTDAFRSGEVDFDIYEHEAKSHGETILELHRDDSRIEELANRIAVAAYRAKCLELGDHIPIRSLPYFKARRLLSTLLIPVTSPPAP